MHDEAKVISTMSQKSVRSSSWEFPSSECHFFRVGSHILDIQDWQDTSCDDDDTPRPCLRLISKSRCMLPSMTDYIFTPNVTSFVHLILLLPFPAAAATTGVEVNFQAMFQASPYNSGRALGRSPP
jgi:hypothetical protein